MEQNKPESAREVLHNPKTMKAMHSVSRFSVGLGFFMVVAVLITAFLKFTAPQPQQAPVRQQVVTPTRTISLQPTLAKLQTTLNGPLTCDYSSTEASLSAVVLDRKVSLMIQEATVTSNLILNGDCIYKWKQNEFTGTKSCNMGQVIQAVEMMSIFGGLDLGTILKALPADSQSKILSNTEFVNNVISSCVKEASNSAVFTVPANVVFTEATDSATVMQP